MDTYACIHWQYCVKTVMLLSITILSISTTPFASGVPAVASDNVTLDLHENKTISTDLFPIIRDQSTPVSQTTSNVTVGWDMTDDETKRRNSVSATTEYHSPGIFQNFTALVSSTESQPLSKFDVNLYKCLMDSDSKTIIKGERGTVTIAFENEELIPGESIWFCTVIVKAPRGKSLTLYNIDLRFAPCPNVVLDLDGKPGSFIHTLNFCGADLPPQKLVTSSDTVYVKLSSYKGGMELTSLTFSFVSVVETERKPNVLTLNITKISDDSGYVTLPHFPDAESHVADFNISAVLTAKPNEAVMISVTRFRLGIPSAFRDCEKEYFAIYTKDKFSKMLKQEFKLCGREKFPVEIYKPPITFIYYTQVYAPSMELKVLFTIHMDTLQPTRLPNGRFDCSTPIFSTFGEHLLCNLETECEHGEDEENCSYSRSQCQGGILSNNKCYTYYTWSAPLTWNQAQDVCASHGGYLVSLNTLEEEKIVQEILTLGKQSIIYIGLRTRDKTLSSTMYRFIREFADGTVAYYVNLPVQSSKQVILSQCASTSQISSFVRECSCYSKLTGQFICEFDVNIGSNNTSKNVPPVQIADILQTENVVWPETFDVVVCPHGGHVVRDFLSCDPLSGCGKVHFPKSCTTSVGNEMEWFVCDDGLRTLPYTLVCDFRVDCLDKSDEIFCHHGTCSGGYLCANQQCVEWEARCDGMGHCTDFSDEENCWWDRLETMTEDTSFPRLTLKEKTFPSPLLIDLDGHGYFTQREIDSQSCPQTHFRCHGKNGNCLPVYVRCNGVFDCPDREDEAFCDDYACPGFYRCRGSRICVHAANVCDDKFQCPQQDDELLCREACPSRCRCQGLAFVCTQIFPARDIDNLRYLDASGSGMSPQDFSSNIYLVFLKLSRCRIQSADNLTFPNLRHLDLSKNLMASLYMDDFVDLPNLRLLRVSSNPILIIEGGRRLSNQLLLQDIDLSLTSIKVFSADAFFSFPNIRHLNLSNSKIEEIENQGFSPIYMLKTVHLEGCIVLRFPRNVFKGLAFLTSVYADNYKLCCKEILPETFNADFCYAPKDVISSCENLLRSHFYRICLWILAGLAVVGNFSTFIFRLRAEKGQVMSGSNVFVINLSIADFLMGMYLVIVGVADQVYRDSYLWEDENWKRSFVCQTAGFLSVLSNEVSAFTICLITLDRIMVFACPFSTIRFRKGSVVAACGIAWSIGAVLAAMPLFRSWELYGRNALCSPLPFALQDSPGQVYSFVVIIILNFILFLFIALGQAVIFWSVKKHSMKKDTTAAKSRELRLVKRLLAVIVTDFLCWFPIGLLGILVTQGIPIPDEVSVLVNILVLPLNSALNPFLYTYSVAAERRQEQKRAKLTKVLENKLRIQMQQMQSRQINE